MPARRVVTGRSQQPRKRFAEELRLLRNGRGESLRELAEHLGWDASTLGKMESGTNLGGPEVVEALDTHYGTPGLLLALWEVAMGDNSQFKEQYRRYMDIEAEASCLWHFGVSTVHGLLQTTAYAREVLTLGGLKGPELEQQVEARTGRRKLLEERTRRRSEPSCPRLSCVRHYVRPRSGGNSWSTCWRSVSDRASLSRCCRTAPVFTDWSAPT